MVQAYYNLKSKDVRETLHFNPIFFLENYFVLETLQILISYMETLVCIP